MNKTIMSWSGGKDSSMALFYAQQMKDLKVESLLTTVTEGYDRISMHGVRNELLENQAKSIGIPVDKVTITQKASEEEWETKMRDSLLRWKDKGASSMVIGDIFLEDLKKYREEQLANVNMTGIFPIWKRDTTELAETFIDLGFKAVITCIDSQKLDQKFAGRKFDQEFLSELPSNIDPCGENGEFHSFVYDGPIFEYPVSCCKGDIVLRDNRFYFCDLLPS